MRKLPGSMRTNSMPMSLVYGWSFGGGRPLGPPVVSPFVLSPRLWSVSVRRVHPGTAEPTPAVSSTASAPHGNLGRRQATPLSSRIIPTSLLQTVHEGAIGQLHRQHEEAGDPPHTEQAQQVAFAQLPQRAQLAFGAGL